MSLETYKNIASAITSIFAPLAEVVIHDLESCMIIYVAGTLSGRKIGDPSLLDQDPASDQALLHTVIYTKVNADGRLLRSLSVPFQSSLPYLMCINCDVSLFKNIQTLVGNFLNVSCSKQPQGLFANDWQEG